MYVGVVFLFTLSYYGAVSCVCDERDIETSFVESLDR